MIKEALTGLECFTTMKDIISTIKDFLSNLSYSISDKPVICTTKEKTYLLFDLFLLSANKTLDSIYVCCVNGCFADANVLIRKYRDDLFLYLFILEVLDNRKKLTESTIQKGYRKNKDDKAVDAWFDNKAFSGKFKRELDIANYFDRLKNNHEIKRCISQYGLEPIWENIRKKLNDYTHNNGIKFIKHNLLRFLNKEDVEDCVKSILQDIGFITSIFLVILILIRPNYIMASDYIDYMDLGIKPPESSQHWVAPFISEYIDEYIVKLHPELKAFLHYNNKYGMRILCD
jgi:hypothetical protein